MPAQAQNPSPAAQDSLKMSLWFGLAAPFFGIALFSWLEPESATELLAPLGLTQEHALWGSLGVALVCESLGLRSLLSMMRKRKEAQAG